MLTLLSMAFALECREVVNMDAAGVPRDEIDMINPHGTSTPLGDLREAEAIKAVFPDTYQRVGISGTKSMTGHAIGAAGALEAVICIEALNANVIPPTINLDNPDPQCDLDYVPNTAREMKIDIALSNSFGFGGTNACIVFRRV